MDSNDPIFSHQLEAVFGLSMNFKKVVVITQRGKSTVTPSNVKIIDLDWIRGRNILNTIRFQWALIKVMRSIKPDLVFSHMTEKLSLIAAPILKFYKIPHFLWYAHTSSSLSLKITSKLVSAIFTSTAGSCPIKSSRVKILGQAIDTSRFRGEIAQKSHPTNYVHVGRLDPSKNIELLIQQVLLTASGNTLTLIGVPSNLEAMVYWEKVKRRYANFFDSRELIATGPTQRSQLPDILENYDAFIHAFNGSLDKSTLEATACGLAVVTTNPEYQTIFGSWTGKRINFNLDTELSGFLNTPLERRENELRRRASLVNANHSFDSWIEKVTLEMMRDRKN